MLETVSSRVWESSCVEPRNRPIRGEGEGLAQNTDRISSASSGNVKFLHYILSYSNVLKQRGKHRLTPSKNKNGKYTSTSEYRKDKAAKLQLWASPSPRSVWLVGLNSNRTLLPGQCEASPEANLLSPSPSCFKAKCQGSSSQGNISCYTS